ncbi:MAG: hypothetical protein FWE54_06800 [Methanimicrococcus sp.]|nr:hypothetical protein [Methanimicrococcus sp.]
MEPELLDFCFLAAMPCFYFLIFMSYIFIYPMGDILSNIRLLLLPLFASVLPGFYLAFRKNFLFFSNQKLNLFPIRLFVLLPGASVFNIIFLMIVSRLISLYSPYLHELNVTSAIILTAFSLFGSLLTILMFSSLLRNDLPPECQPNFMEHKLYLFRPVCNAIDYFQNPYNLPAITDSYGILPNPSRHCIRYQKNDLEIDLNKKGPELLFTTLGAVIVSSKVLRIFEDNKLTGYETRSVRDKKTKQQSVNYYQIVPTSEMPKMSYQTKIKERPAHLLEYGYYISDGVVRYDVSAIAGASDFNKTAEYIGSSSGMPYFSQKFLIVSHKTMEILINQVGQKKRYFVPVILVDDNDYKNESAYRVK